MAQDLNGRFTGNGKIRPFMNDIGFTILEMVVVTALLAMGATIAVWNVNSILPDMRLKAAVRNLKSDMQMARLAAIRHNTFIVSEFNTDNNSYTIFIDDGGKDGEKANNYCQDSGETTIKSIRIHPHVKMFRAKFGAVSGKFAFNSRGAIDGLAGGVYMHNKLKKYRGVTVSRIGKITIKAGAGASALHSLY
ncbi:MAG: hypothetical protein PVJ84_11240 [Desulfobacteraceae bacterium]|jgi:Tfp pilus assembly protein FimT